MSGGVLGTPNDWAGVIEDQAPKILKLVKAAWKRVPVGPLDEREDDITNRFIVVLQRSRRARKMMFYIHPQVVELDATGDEYGRMDIGFYPSNQPWVPREDIYFCIECKRLNVVRYGTPRSYASEYVTLGMTRFVTGQYSRAVQHGCMVGYVRDGDVKGAMANVEQNIEARQKELSMDALGKLRPSEVFPRTVEARETHHRRGQQSAPFRLHHLFMAGNPNAAVTVTRRLAKKRRVGKRSWRRRK